MGMHDPLEKHEYTYRFDTLQESLHFCAALQGVLGKSDGFHVWARINATGEPVVDVTVPTRLWLTWVHVFVQGYTAGKKVKDLT